MPKEKTFRALVVREVAVGESDKLLTALAEGIGKLTIICKGVRNIKSQRLASTQLFCYDEFTVSQRNEMYYLKEASLIENFYTIREDIESLALAEYICDAVGEVSLEGAEGESDGILSLALNTLYMISKKSRPLLFIKSVFEMRLCSIIGFEPYLDNCSVCGKETDSGVLDINGGVLICSDCILSEEITQSFVRAELSPALLSALLYIVRAPSKRLFSFSLGEDEIQKLSEICEKYFLARVEHGFDTLRFFNSLINLP